MKVCLVGDGRSIHVRRWVSYLSGRGHEVHVVTDRPDATGDAINHRIWMPGAGPSYAVKGWQTKRIIARIKPDVVHAHYAQGYGLFGAMSGFHPFVVTAWGGDILNYPQKSERARGEVERTLASADAVTCMSEHMFAHLRDHYKLGQKLSLTRWGIDTETFHRGYGDEAAALRQAMGIPADATVELSARGMLDVYGNHRLVEAAAEVLKARRNVYFVFARGTGSKSYEDGVRQLARRLGVEANARFVGRLLEPRELAVHMNAADISTSLVPYGQFGAVLLESMNCGCVQLASDIDIHREKLAHMKNGLLVDRENKGAISDAILHFCAHPGIKEEFYAANKELVEKTESWRNNARSTEELYKRLVQ